MGIIDSTTYTLTCPNCGTTETNGVTDKGNRWSGSFWDSGAEFPSFKTAWVGGEKKEPELQEAVCKKCNISASVKIS